MQTATQLSNRAVKESSSSENNKVKVSSQRDKNLKQKHFHGDIALTANTKDKAAITTEELFGGVARKLRIEAKRSRLKKLKRLDEYGNNCRVKQIARKATLRSGMDAGKFKLHGKSHNITDCAELCCDDRLCDIAVIMTGRCYTVQCFSAKDCESKTVRDKASSVVIAYMNNRWKNYKNRSSRSRVKVARYEIRNKKTVVPNPSEGNYNVTSCACVL